MTLNHLFLVQRYVMTPLSKSFLTCDPSSYETVMVSYHGKLYWRANNIRFLNTNDSRKEILRAALESITSRLCRTIYGTHVHHSSRLPFKMLDVYIKPNITSSRTMEKLRHIILTHGLLRKIVTDNEPLFMSDEFKKFVEANGIKHITLALYHPFTIGFVKSAV